MLCSHLVKLDLLATVADPNTGNAAPVSRARARASIDYRALAGFTTPPAARLFGGDSSSSSNSVTGLRRATPAQVHVATITCQHVRMPVSATPAAIAGCMLHNSVCRQYTGSSTATLLHSVGVRM